MTTGATRPTYIGIGAQKCASTWLHRILSEHPQVAAPAEKEIEFFTCRYNHGYQWYERCFIGAEAALARGEFATSYFCEPAVPERVARYMPDAKILLTLRDPVQRALSNHRHEVRAGNLRGTDLSFEAGLRNNPMYVQQGLYATHFRNWLRHFRREQILVVLTEDVATDPRAVSAAVYRFVGVDDAYVPAGLTNQYNRSYANRWSPLAALKNAVYGATRLPGLRLLWSAAAGAGLRSLYRSVNRRPSGTVIPPPAPQTLVELRQRFEPEIRELETLIGRSLTTWLAH